VLIESDLLYVLHPGKAPALVAYEQEGAARGRSCQAVGRSRLAALRANLREQRKAAPAMIDRGAGFDKMLRGDVKPWVRER
jgi:hypothetical protein